MKLNKDSIILFIRTNSLAIIITITSLLTFIFLKDSFSCKNHSIVNSVREPIKADYSSDRSFLSCIRIQRECLFGNIENETFDNIKQNCGGIEYCDTKHSFK